MLNQTNWAVLSLSPLGLYEARK